MDGASAARAKLALKDTADAFSTSNAFAAHQLSHLHAPPADFELRNFFPVAIKYGHPLTRVSRIAE